MDSFGTGNFLTLEMKGHVLQCPLAHLKAQRCLLVRNTLVIKKLPMFLSVLNESNGDSEKILLVSVLCCSSVNFFRTMDLLSSCEFEI